MAVTKFQYMAVWWQSSEVAWQYDSMMVWQQGGVVADMVQGEVVNCSMEVWRYGGMAV